jgi:hypothetical protein
MFYIVLSGVFLFFNYFLIIKAYENSSSTVIIPFLQLSTISGVALTYIQAMVDPVGSSQSDNFSTRSWMGYILIMCGSILPATGGRLGILFNKEFWSQKFIVFVVISEASYGVYNMILSHNYTENHGENFECFILSRLGFVLVFSVMFLTSSRIRKHIFAMWNVSWK